MNNRMEHALNVVLTVAAVTVAFVAIRRELQADRPGVKMYRSEYVAEWKTLKTAARLIGSETAPVTIVEITDFQCPFCKKFNDVIHAVQREFPLTVSVAIVHFPLPGHSHARVAAQAVECASRFGRTASMIDALFLRKDSLGKKPWTSYAADADISDSLAFGSCLNDPSSLRLVDLGLAAGTEAGVTGTPTIILNGWKYGVPPSDTELVRAVKDILAGKKPYPDFPSKALAHR